MITPESRIPVIPITPSDEIKRSRGHLAGQRGWGFAEFTPSDSTTDKRIPAQEISSTENPIGFVPLHDSFDTRVIKMLLEVLGIWNQETNG